MTNMVNKAQGFGLSLITKMASSDVLDQLKLRKFVEKSLYQGSKAGYKTLSKTQKAFKTNKDLHKQRLNNQEKSLFDYLKCERKGYKDGVRDMWEATQQTCIKKTFISCSSSAVCGEIIEKENNVATCHLNNCPIAQKLFQNCGCGI